MAVLFSNLSEVLSVIFSTIKKQEYIFSKVNYNLPKRVKFVQLWLFGVNSCLWRLPYIIGTFLNITHFYLLPKSAEEDTHFSTEYNRISGNLEQKSASTCSPPPPF